MRQRKSIFVGPPQPEIKLDWIRQIEGKTVEWVDFGIEKKVRGAHSGEGVVFHFTDGSHLQLVIGSNAGNIAEDPEEFDTDIMVLFRESGDPR
jgi:hypothetical protein